MDNFRKVEIDELREGLTYTQSQNNKGKILSGRLIYKGKLKDNKGYGFQTLDGFVESLTEEDLKANPMVMPYFKQIDIKNKEQELRVQELGGKYTHDPMQLFRTAHKNTYGVNLRANSVGKMLVDDDNSDVLGYLLNINKHDYLLLIGKKDDGTLDYTFTDYGMKSLKDADTVSVDELVVGTKYWVDRYPRMQYIGCKDGLYSFRSTGNGNLFFRFTREHIDLYNNIRKKQEKEGSLEKLVPFKEYEDTEKNRAIVSLMKEGETNIIEKDMQNRAEEIKQNEELAIKQSGKGSVSGSIYLNRPFASISGFKSAFAVNTNNLEANHVYITPFGEAIYQYKLRGSGKKYEKSITGKDDAWEPASRSELEQVSSRLTAQGMDDVLKAFKKRRVLYKFISKEGYPVYFTSKDISDGILLKLDDVLYHIPSEDNAKFRGCTNENFAEYMNFTTSYKAFIESSVNKPCYIFDKGNCSYRDLLENRVVKMPDVKKQMRRNIRKDARENMIREAAKARSVSNICNTVMLGKEEAEGLLCMTPGGEAVYLYKESKKYIDDPKQNNRYCFRLTATGDVIYFKFPEVTEEKANVCKVPLNQLCKLEGYQGSYRYLGNGDFAGTYLFQNIEDGSVISVDYETGIKKGRVQFLEG